MLDTGGSDYNNVLISGTSSSGTATVASATATSIALAASIDNSPVACSILADAVNIQAASWTKFKVSLGYLNSAGADFVIVEGHGFRREADRITGVNFALSAGTGSGTLTLTGSR